MSILTPSPCLIFHSCYLNDPHKTKSSTAQYETQYKQYHSLREFSTEAADSKFPFLGFQSHIIVFVFMEKLFQWHEENSIFKFSSL